MKPCVPYYYRENMDLPFHFKRFYKELETETFKGGEFSIWK